MRRSLVALAASVCLVAPLASHAKEPVCIIHAGGQTIGLFPLPPDNVPHCRHATEAAQRAGLDAHYIIACWGGSAEKTVVTEGVKDEMPARKSCK